MKRTTAVFVAVAFLFTVLCVCVLPLSAQTDMKTVRGTVIDKAENPLPSAIVHLKNVKTMSVRTYISDSTGQFRFSGLDPNVDYELHAETDALTSATRTISSFNSSRDIEVVLKVSHKKKSG